jgi:hypothetical protein
MLVAIGAASSSEEVSAMTVLRAQGAAHIERAQGKITQNQCNEFDPQLALEEPAWLHELQRQGRRRSSVIIERCAHLAPDHLTKAANRLDSVGGRAALRRRSLWAYGSHVRYRTDGTACCD